MACMFNIFNIHDLKTTEISAYKTVLLFGTSIDYYPTIKKEFLLNTKT